MRKRLLTDEEKASIYADYISHVKPAVIREKYQISYATIYHVVKGVERPKETHYKITEEMGNVIIQEYQSGTPVSIIRKMFEKDLADETVRNFLKSEGVFVKKEPRVLFEEEKKAILEDYQKEVSLEALMEKYNCRWYHLDRLLKEHPEVPRRTREMVFSKSEEELHSKITHDYVENHFTVKDLRLKYGLADYRIRSILTHKKVYELESYRKERMRKEERERMLATRREKIRRMYLIQCETEEDARETANEIVSRLEESYSGNNFSIEVNGDEAVIDGMVDEYGDYIVKTYYLDIEE